MCTVPVRNFRSKSPEAPEAQDAPLEGALADPSPSQVMLAVLRAARADTGRPHLSKSQPRPETACRHFRALALEWKLGYPPS